MTDPVAEFRATSSFPAHPLHNLATQAWVAAKPVTRPYLSAIGTYPGLAPFTILSLSLVELDEETGLFEIDKRGRPVVLTPIREGDIWYGDIVDLVAWHPKFSGAYTYHGSTTLGCAPASGPITAHRSVLEWFRAGCEGVVILRW